MRIAVVIGNPKPGSRTLSAALAVADDTQAALGISERLVLDLATYGGALLDRSSTEVTVAVALMTGAAPVTVHFATNTGTRPSSLSTLARR